MRNKIAEITYFICLAILSEIFLPVYALKNDTRIQITASLTENKYNSTEEIENLFKTNIEPQNEIVYTKVPRGLIVSINSSIFFEEGQDEIKEDSKTILNKIGEILKITDKSCVVEDNSGNKSPQSSIYQSNWEFSIVRAEKIAQYLIKCQNLNPKKIRAIGFGEIMPFNDNVSYGLNMNRRIDFVILNYEKNVPIH